MHPILLDAAGRRRQPVTLPGYHVGRPPRNKGRRYPANPPAVLEPAPGDREGYDPIARARLRANYVVLSHSPEGGPFPATWGRGPAAS